MKKIMLNIRGFLTSFGMTTDLSDDWLSFRARSARNLLLIFPNPASEQISFVLDEAAEVSIFDMTGRKVSTMNVVAGEAQLNVSELVNGVYFVNFRFANGSTAVSKFVKF